MRAYRRFNALIPAALVGLLALPDLAWAFRCGNKLVLAGDTAGAVVARCGEPSERTRHVILRPAVIWSAGHPYQVGSSPLEVVVETWIYNLGSHRLMQRVRLEDGLVVEVGTLGYGHP